MKKILCAAALSMFSALRIFSLPFNGMISGQELDALVSGEVVVRNIGSAKNISIEASSSGAKKILEQIKSLDPNYLAEVIQVRPYAGNENLPEELFDILMNIPDYVGIPYYSEQGGAWYDLYSDAKIVSTEKAGGTTTNVVADLTMEPFGLITTVIEIEMAGEYLLYSTTNSNRLRYQDKFNCVGAGKMRSCILLFRDGGDWILYGVGGVDAARVPFLTRRIETSFINRIKTFCNYIFEKL